MQNIIAIIWDFDKTLIDGYMQDPIFAEYKVDPVAYWKKVNALPEQYAEKGIRVNPDTAYLIQFVRDAKSGLFRGLDNKKLREYGARQKYYPGIPDFLRKTKHLLDGDPECAEFSIRVEHYIVSTGFAEVIKGSSLNDLVEGIWGCELIDEKIDDVQVISEPCYTIDNTTKTRALFEINKGVNAKSKINVNTKMSAGQRRVAFENMIYIADGPSDVPAFSLIKKNGGVTFAVFPKGRTKEMNQVEKLRLEGRVDYYAEADYVEGSTTYNWLTQKILSIAERIKQTEKNKLAVDNLGPKHIVE